MTNIKRLSFLSYDKVGRTEGCSDVYGRDKIREKNFEKLNIAPREYLISLKTITEH